MDATQMPTSTAAMIIRPYQRSSKVPTWTITGSMLMAMEFIPCLLYNKSMSLKSLIGTLATLLFVLVVPLAVIFSGWRWMILDPGVYERGFVKYRVAEATGMSSTELSTAAQQLIAYFADDRPITLQIRKDGQMAPLYNERELSHLVDVRGLFQLVFRIQAVAVAYLILYILAALILRVQNLRRRIAWNVLGGAALTLIFLAGLGLAAMSDFSTLWPALHLLSFSNDLWMLDPRTDYMIRMFPLGFWYDAVLKLATISAASSAALLLAATAYLRFSRPRL
ncbi:MAG: TIGR01906 family membrane protein [Chloroflexota bacterium]|nr:MAG: TIGR01906 family membrane protein [Chloroflexota bacterium]